MKCPPSQDDAFRLSAMVAYKTASIEEIEEDLRTCSSPRMREFLELILAYHRKVAEWVSVPRCEYGHGYIYACGEPATTEISVEMHTRKPYTAHYKACEKHKDDWR